jgi:hypothetical protein
MQYDHDVRRLHEHVGSDTLDYDLWMNPSVVMKWPPNERSLGYFGLERYENISGEYMSAVDFRVGDEALRVLQPMLKPGGVCSGNVLTVTDPTIDHRSRVAQLAETCGLSTKVESVRQREVGGSFKVHDICFSFSKPRV